jgi:hypothetical protein
MSMWSVPRRFRLCSHANRTNFGEKSCGRSRCPRGPVVVEVVPGLRTDDNLVAHVSQRRRQQRLPLAVAVGVRCVEKRHALVVSPSHEIDPDGVIRNPPPRRGHGPEAEADGGELKIGVGEGSVLHLVSFRAGRRDNYRRASLQSFNLDLCRFPLVAQRSGDRYVTNSTIATIPYAP